MYLLTTVLPAFLAISTTAGATNPHECPSKIGPGAINVRIPPKFNTHASYSTWQAPPVGWYYKPWYTIWATNPQYAAFRNLEYDPTPVDPNQPAGQVNDLFSFQLKHNDTIYTTYGVDTPNKKYRGVLDYNATGIIAGATSEYSFLAWGCDECGRPYYASYSTETTLTGTPAGLDILSTADGDFCRETLHVLIDTLKKSSNAVIAGLARNLTVVEQDGWRKDLPRTTCDDYCKSNANLKNLLGGGSS